MKRTRILLVVLGVALVGALGMLGLAASTQDVILNITIEESLWLTVTGTNVVDFPDTAVDDTMPVAANNSITLVGQNNYADTWQITTAATTDFENAGGTNEFAITKLQFDVDNAGNFTPYNAVGGAVQTVGEVTVAGPGSEDFEIDFRLTLDGSETADNYSATVHFDIVET